MSKPRARTISSHSNIRGFQSEQKFWADLEGEADLKFTRRHRKAIKDSANQYALTLAEVEDAGNRAALLKPQKKPGDLSLDVFRNRLEDFVSVWQQMQKNETAWKLLSDFETSFAQPLNLNEAMTSLETAAFLLPGHLEKLKSETSAPKPGSNQVNREAKVRLIAELADLYSDAGGLVSATGGGSIKAIPPFVAFVRAVLKQISVPPLASSGTAAAWSDVVNKLLQPWREGRPR